MDELSLQYKNKVDFYRVDVDQEKKLAGSFGINGIPAFLFVPTTGKPQMIDGFHTKEQFIEIIDKFLLNKK